MRGRDLREAAMRVETGPSNARRRVRRAATAPCVVIARDTNRGTPTLLLYDCTLTRTPPFHYESLLFCNSLGSVIDPLNMAVGEFRRNCKTIHLIKQANHSALCHYYSSIRVIELYFLFFWNTLNSTVYSLNSLDHELTWYDTKRVFLCKLRDVLSIIDYLMASFLRIGSWPIIRSTLCTSLRCSKLSIKKRQNTFTIKMSCIKKQVKLLDLTLKFICKGIDP